MNDSELMQLTEKLIREYEVDVDQYMAFMAGVNVGMEAEHTDRLKEMNQQECIEWFIEMYEARVGEA